MINVTEIRREIRETVAEHTGATNAMIDVRLGPSSYAAGRADSSEMNFTVKIVLAKGWIEAKHPTEDATEILDQWLIPSGDTSLKEHLEGHTPLKDLVDDVMVTKTSGHRVYQESPNGPPRIGAEWTVRTLA